MNCARIVKKILQITCQILQESCKLHDKILEEKCMQDLSYQNLKDLERSYKTFLVRWVGTRLVYHDCLDLKSHSSRGW